jgi:hypothetical protein
MALDKRIILAGLQQLNRKYAGKGVDRVVVQMLNGRPFYVMQGPTKNPPAGLPGQIRLSPDQTIPIIWAYTRTALGTPLPEPNEKTVNSAMWYGFVNIDRRDVATVYQPGSDTIVTQKEDPPADVTDLQVAVDVTGSRGWWDIAMELEGCLCCSFYNQPITLLNYVVPQDRVLYVDGWAFFVYLNVPIGWTFNVRFLRDGETLLTYDEVVVDPTNPDPALRCLFSGSVEQVMNSYLRIDRGQTLSVVITPKGLFPFVNDPQQTVCGNICVLLHAHSTALLDNRDGAPRPKDVGAMRDDLTGTGLLEQVTKEDVSQLLVWLNGASKEAVPVPSAEGQVSGSSSMEAIVAPPTAEVRSIQQAQADKALTDAATTANSNLLATILAAGAAASMLGGGGSGSSLTPDPLST